MFSATMSPEIARIAKTYLHEAKEITIGTKNEGSKNVNHVAYIVHAKDKYLALKRVVDFILRFMVSFLPYAQGNPGNSR